MENIYKSRINALRAEMAKHGIAATIISQADPHMSEYLPEHWERRLWLTGFSGSAGELVVTADKAALWTDSRYFLQASLQLEGTGVELMKDGLADTPSMEQWIVANVPAGSTVGADGMLMSATAMQMFKRELAKNGISLDCHFDPMPAIWKDRPGLPDGKVYIHDEKYTGESAASRIARTEAGVKAAGGDSLFLSALDDIAWVLNIRCNDIDHSPVASSFLYLAPGKRVLFINKAKIDDEVARYLGENGIVLMPYDAPEEFLKALPADEKVVIEPAHTPGAIADVLGSRALEVMFSPVTMIKNIKNDVQIDGTRSAMERDGVALVKAFMELERLMASGDPVYELDVNELLYKYRAEQPRFKDLSFGSISGYGPHGAIVHYEPTPESNARLRPEGLLLMDSGAQYLDGTTDITRTIALGKPTEQEKRDFTLVLKGHIALSNIMFPAGTTGHQLDVLARQFLWREGLSYLHGTGHGIGFFLNDHEGPQSIRLNHVPVALRPGMTVSNEPGLYRADVHGIRCENIVLVRRAISNEFGDFYNFETLTLFPFDLSLLDLGIMTQEELDWLNDYHARVFSRLRQYLNEEETAWLADKTREVKK